MEYLLQLPEDTQLLPQALILLLKQQGIGSGVLIHHSLHQQYHAYRGVWKEREGGEARGGKGDGEVKGGGWQENCHASQACAEGHTTLGIQGVWTERGGGGRGRRGGGGKTATYHTS